MCSASRSQDVVDKTDYRRLALYLRFAELLEESYARTRDLTHLNAFLKCLDTLISIRRDLSDKERGRLSRLLAAERDHAEWIRDA